LGRRPGGLVQLVRLHDIASDGALGIIPKRSSEGFGGARFRQTQLALGAVGKNDSSNPVYEVKNVNSGRYCDQTDLNAELAAAASALA
jgi:hypothetical protein